MDLLSIVIVLIVIGVGLYLVNMIPMEATIKKILNAVVVIITILWLLKVFDVINILNVHIGN